MRSKAPTWLVILFVIAAGWTLTFFAVSLSGWMDLFFNGKIRPAAPFHIQYSNRVSSVSDDWDKAGLHLGDRVLSVNGVPFTGFQTVYSQVWRMHPGDILHVTVQPANGAAVTISHPIEPVVPPDFHKPVSIRVLGVMLQIVFPTFCTLLGLWVLAAKMRDPNAWYLCGILQYFQTFYGLAEHFTSWNLFMAISQQISEIALLIGLVMFGISFPERLNLDRRFPWAKLVVLVPFAILTPLDIYEETARYYAIRWFHYLPVDKLHYFDTVEQSLSGICIGFFCAVIFSKFFSIKNRDSRRRLGVIVAGSQFGIWPLFILVLVGTFRHREINQAAPYWVFISVLLLFALFPLSLAYSIIVQRAMDVRLLLRQGTQYALAKGTFWVIRIGLGAAIAWITWNALHKAAHHEQQTPAEIIWAIVVLALFFLLRFGIEKRARKWIDRRFFREAYSSEQILSELVEQVGRFTETTPLLETVTHRIADTLHIARMGVLLQCPGGYCMEQVIGADIPREGHLGDGSYTIESARKAQRPITIYDQAADGWSSAAAGFERQMLRDLSAELLLPLPGRSRLVGVIAMGPKRSEEPYSRTDLQLLQSVAAQTGLVIENSQLVSSLAHEIALSERNQREMQIAREVQERLFPQKFPAMPGVDIAGFCRPALGIGGDYYDFIALGDGYGGTSHTRIGLAVGDISGKGISAALLMASLRASLRGQTLSGFDVAHLVQNVNTLLYDSSDDNRYATFFFAQYDTESRKLTYVNAGHNPPMLLRPKGVIPGAGASLTHEILRLEEGGPVVGLLEHADYKQCELQLETGDILIAYTDGISEAMDPADEEWGEEAMMARALTCTGLSAQGMLENLFAAADEFSIGAPQHDDMTLVIMKVQP